MPRSNPKPAPTDMAAFMPTEPRPGTSSSLPLALLRLVSPSLPVGAFAWSEGLESAVEVGWICSPTDTLDWVRGRLNGPLVQLDLPITRRLLRAHASGQLDEALRWSARLLASRETRELRDQERQLGRSLARLLAETGIPEASAWTDHRYATWSGLFALAGARLGIAETALLEGYAFAWCESQVAAAVKLVPLGQTVGQQCLVTLLEDIPDAVQRAVRRTDEEIGASEPGLAIASALHEVQYSRLFRS